jgi:hypothetical protein
MTGGLIATFAAKFYQLSTYSGIMKKMFPIVFLLFVFGIPAVSFSQAKFPVKLGLKVAPNLGWMAPGTKGYSSDGARFGGTIGFMSDFYFSQNYAFSTGLNFQFINSSLSYSDSLQVAEQSKYVMKYGAITSLYKIMYLEIPIMVKMSTKTFGKMSYFGQIGFGTGFRLNANKTDNFQPTVGEPQELNYEYNGGTTLIRESLLIGLGAEYHLDESSRVVIGVSYSNSLNNVLTGKNYSTNEIEKSHLNYLELNIGFIF